ncbi:MAG: purine-nucleoside phosphorylase, partial [Ignavibacteria bacterium]|nr:purine-nucleoside phosphorylase [Ignavibacteria bacterium]
DKTILFEDKTGVHNKLIYTCTIANKRVLVFKGRRHFYEGYSLEEITSHVDFAIERGAENIFITNAAGGLNENFSEGDLMLITSHINFIDKLKFRISGDIKGFYSKELQNKFMAICKVANVKLHEGTYGCYSGPTYETNAEIRFQKKIMLDAAGMSTVPEVISASKHKINVLAVSVITNLLRENSISQTSHDDVLLTAKIASNSLKKVLPVFISQLN